MKTSELIRRLQAADPDGDAEVVVDGIDIRGLARTPGRWDGPYETFQRDTNDRIIGAARTCDGYKVVLRPQSIEDAVWDDPELPVTCDCSEYTAKVEEWRRRAHGMHNALDAEYFTTWARDRFPDVSAADAGAFWWAHYTHTTPMPPDIAALYAPRPHGESGLSYIERRYLQWDREVELCAGELVRVVDDLDAEPL